MIHYSLNIGVVMSRLPVFKTRDSIDYENVGLDITIYIVFIKLVNE